LLGESFMSQPQVETHWFSESGVLDIFLLLGPTISDVFYQHRQLTGATPLPPVCPPSVDGVGDIQSVL